MIDRLPLANIAWTLTGKVRSVVRSGGSLPDLRFGYNANGNRYKKEVLGDLTDDGTLEHTDYYVHDATGNIMAIYRFAPGDGEEEPMSLKVTERPIYGSKRVGVDTHPQELIEETEPELGMDGMIHYEITDHLGNVVATVSDALVNVDADEEADYNQADVLSLQDYEPFGALLPGRNFSIASYNYGFQGQIKDNEIYGSDGTALSFEYRVHDARVGRFLSLDPLAFKYPWNSPYAFSENRVIDAIELEGLESYQLKEKALALWAPFDTFFGNCGEVIRECAEGVGNAFVHLGEAYGDYVASNATGGLPGVPNFGDMPGYHTYQDLKGLGQNLSQIPDRWSNGGIAERTEILVGTAFIVVASARGVKGAVAGRATTNVGMIGGKVEIQYARSADDIAYLNSVGAEATYFSQGNQAGFMLVREGASRPTILEELIHHNQKVQHGEEYFLRNNVALEIEAQDILLETGKKEGWGAEEMGRITRAKEAWQAKQ